MKILLAEDDFVTRKFMANFLSKYGDCDVTVDGMEAVDAFMLALEEDEPYDLVCLDIMMPNMDAVTTKALQWLRLSFLLRTRLLQSQSGSARRLPET